MKTYFCILLIGVIIGFSISPMIDFPYYKFDESVNIFDYLTFFLILSYGYYFQDIQRKKVHKNNASQLLLQDTAQEVFLNISNIGLELESFFESGAPLDIKRKKSIQLKFKTISILINFLMEHINDESQKKLMEQYYNNYKKFVVSEEFSKPIPFSIDDKYLKNVNSYEGILKIYIRKTVFRLISES